MLVSQVLDVGNKRNRCRPPCLLCAPQLLFEMQARAAFGPQDPPPTRTLMSVCQMPTDDAPETVPALSLFYLRSLRLGLNIAQTGVDLAGPTRRRNEQGCFLCIGLPVPRDRFAPGGAGPGQGFF